MKNLYYKNDVCIVGMGCVLPDAKNVHEFWNNVLNGNCSIKSVPGDRWKKDLYFSSDKSEKDKSYSNVGAFVGNDQIETIIRKHDLRSVGSNRLHAMTLEATAQALECLSSAAVLDSSKNTAVFLGCMEIDEALTKEKFFSYNKKSLQDYIEKNNLKNKDQIIEKIENHFISTSQIKDDSLVASVLTSSVINLIKRKFNLQGEGALVDAACASSLAALDIAVMALKSYKTDLAISGGIESNLAPDTFVLFSKVGALSEGRCAPFDQEASGLSQGEGAAIFVLQRLEDAIRDKNKIYGIIKSSGSSSDGKSSSLFSPSVKGQLLALERAYNGLEKNSVNYIECHGTGTKLGDGIELKALNTFFQGMKIPVGSVKSLVGHTKGAAGAVGLLKCLLSMKNKKIPPSKYLTKFIGVKSDPAYINNEPIDLKNNISPLRFGISSFGFGNANFHVVLDEFAGDYEVIDDFQKNNEGNIAIIANSAISPEEIDFDLIVSKFKIPFKSLSHIDKVQLQALLAADKAFEKANMDINSLDRENVIVISASSLGLDSALDLMRRVRHFEFIDTLDFLNHDSLDVMIKHKEKFAEITEDTGPGVLNNVIAGRICNAFDFNGENFNIDSDFNSASVAINVAMQKLNKKEGIVVLVHCDEKLSLDGSLLERNMVRCSLLSTVEFAKANNYPICEIIERINFYDSK